MADSNILRDILENPEVTGDTRGLAADLLRQQARMENLGIETEGAIEPRRGVFKSILNAIDTPRQVIAGLFDAALARKDIGEIGILGAAKRGMEEDITGADILRRGEVKSPLTRAIVGFGLDLGLDPLTYVGGAGLLTKIAGKGLSATGAATKVAAEAKLLEKGLDIVKVGEMSEDAGRAMLSFQRNLKLAKKMQKAGSTEAAYSAHLAAERARDIFKPWLEAAAEKTGRVLNEAEIADLFVKPGVNVGVTLPFLGHFKPTKTFAQEVKNIGGPVAEAASKPGIIRKALLGMGEAVESAAKPGYIGGRIEIPEKVANILSDAVSLANEKYLKFKYKAGELAGKTIDALDKVPVVGQAASLPLKAGREIAKGVSVGGKVLKSIFARTFHEGGLNRQIHMERVNANAGARRLGQAEAIDVLGPLLSTVDSTGRRIVNKEALEEAKSALLKLDATAENIIAGPMALPEVASKRQELMGVLDRLSLTDDIPDDILRSGLLPEAASNQFRENLNLLLQAPTTTPGERAFIETWLRGHDNMLARELNHGVKVGMLDSYVMHRFLNRAATQGVGAATDVTKRRKYASFSEALRGGLIGDTDPMGLYATRREISERMIARKKYDNRFFIQNGIPEDVYQRLAVEAMEEPGGPAWQMLSSEGYRIPKALSPELESQLAQIIKTQRVAREAVTRGKATKIKEGDLVSEILQGGDTSRHIPAEMVDELTQAAQEYQQTLAQRVAREGYRVADFNEPRALFGEVADDIIAHNGERIVLPTHLAQAYRENTQGADVIKKLFGKSEIGKKFLSTFDAASNFIKKMYILPFPAYWSQNLFGAQFLSAAERGWGAMSPGGMARTIRILTGDSGLRLANGAILDSTTFKNFLRDNGMLYNANDFAEFLDTAGKFNLDKALASKNSIVENLTSKANFRLGLEQAHQKAQDMFEGIFRVDFVRDRIEKGDTLQGALRASNEALIDYRNLSPIEQSLMRRFYMFYGWTAGSTKKALLQTVTNPGALQQQIKAARATAEAFSDPNAVPTAEEFDMKLLDSATMSEQISFAIGKGKDGKRLMARGFGLPLNTLLQQFTLNKPRSFKIDELISWTSETLGRNFQKQIATANPLINMAGQALSGKNLYFDKPLNAEFLRRLPSFEAAAKRLGVAKYTDIPKDLDAAMIKWLKAVPDGKGRLVADPGRFWVLTNLIPGLSRAISTLTPAATESFPAGTALLPIVSGVRIEEQDPERSMLAGIAQRLKEQSVGQSYNLRRKAALGQ